MTPQKDTKVSGTPPSGEMTVEITIMEVTIKISGPVVRVLNVLSWLFGSQQEEAIIQRLQLAFGPEVAMKTKQ